MGKQYFGELTDEMHQELMEILWDAIRKESSLDNEIDQDALITEGRNGEYGEKQHLYDLELNDIRFQCMVSDEQMETAMEYCVDILEELKRIANKGFDRDKLSEATMKVEEHQRMAFGKLVDDNERLPVGEVDLKEIEDYIADAFTSVQFYKSFATEQLELIKRKLANVFCTAPELYIVISNPGMSSAIYAVFDQMVDCFNDENAYATSAYFLLRSALYMYCREWKGHISTNYTS